MEAQPKIRNERALMRVILLQGKKLLLLNMVIPYSCGGIHAVRIKTNNCVIKGQLHPFSKTLETGKSVSARAKNTSFLLGVKSYHKKIFKEVKNKISLYSGHSTLSLHTFLNATQILS